MIERVRGDFNGLIGNHLCLSHDDTALSQDGRSISLRAGMELIAFDPDEEDGKPCFLVARGVVVPSPDSLAEHGSRWCLLVDDRGYRHVESLDDA